MKNKNIFAITSFLILIGISFCVYTYSQSNTLMSSKKVVLSLLDDLKEGQYGLANEVSKSRMGTVLHYDNIKLSIRDLKRLNRKFNAEIFPVSFVNDNNIEDLISEYKIQTEGKIEGIESFKTVNSVINNAERVMPGQVYYLIKTANERKDYTLLESINTTNQTVRKYLNERGGKAYKEELEKAIPILTEHTGTLSKNSGLKTGVNEFVSQLEAVIKRYDATFRAVEIATRTTEVNYLNTIGRQYVSYIDTELEQFSFIRNSTIAVVIGLLTALLVFAFNIYDRSKRLVVANSAANESEKKYKARTKQFYATEPLAVLGDSVSETVESLNKPFSLTVGNLKDVCGFYLNILPILSQFKNISESAKKTDEFIRKEEINKHFKSAFHTFQNLPQANITEDKISEYVEDAELANVYLNRLMSYQDMATTTRTEISLSNIINDELNRFKNHPHSEQISVDLEKTPKLLINQRPVKKVINEIIKKAITKLDDTGKLEVSSSTNNEGIVAKFMVKTEVRSSGPSLSNHTSTVDQTEIMLAFQESITVIGAQGGVMRATGAYDGDFTISIVFPLPDSSIH